MEFEKTTKIESVTIQGMHHIKKKTYRFDDINYLHGKNGAGKSTILNAIQLAILGYIPGTPKQTSAIFQHASSPEMKITIIFNNGRVIERSWRIKGRSIDSQLAGNFTSEEIRELIKDLELPIFNFNELIGLTANKLKDWFINFLPSDSIEIDWNKELSNCLGGIKIMDSSMLESALKTLNAEDGKTLIEKIQVFNAMMKSNQSYLKSELQRSEATIQSMIYYDEDGLVGDSDYLDEEVSKARSQIQDMTAKKEELIRASQILASNQKIQSQLAAIAVPSEDMLAQMVANLESIKAAIDTLDAEIKNAQDQSLQNCMDISDLQSQIRSKESIVQGKGICPYTSKNCDSISAMVESFISEIDSLRKRIQDIKDKENILNQSTAEKKHKLDDLRREHTSVYMEIQAAENAASTVARLNSMIQASPDINSFADIGFYKSEIDRLNQKITKIEANKQYNALVDKLTSEKYQLENSIEVQKCWIKLTDPNGLQTKIMDAPFKNLADDMNKYLSIMFSEDVRCNFNLEQKANSFSFGIIRGSNYIPYDLLSSGEKTMYTLALMLCIVNKTSSPLKLLIVDDMLDHLDDERADDVFQSLGKIDNLQVIVAGVKDSEFSKTYTIEVVKE